MGREEGIETGGASGLGIGQCAAGTGMLISFPTKAKRSHLGAAWEQLGEDAGGWGGWLRQDVTVEPRAPGLST